MIVTRLMGGLGNQMFQYAAGKSLAERLGVPLLLDRTFLDQKPENAGYTLRNFELDVFRTGAQFANHSLVRKMRRPLESRLHRRLKRFFPFFADHVFYETDKRFIPEFSTLKDPVYMEGYWQNEKYFLPVAGDLREKYFVPVKEISGLNADLLNEIKNTASASLHVRRGDYVTLESAHKFHGICSVDYYERSAKILAGEKGVKQFFIFSDEPEWVKANIRLPYPSVIVSHNTGRESYWDLQLMRHCKHHIIANSSFSWWGAWLNEYKEKTVIAPKNWFAENSENEIIPAGWIKN